MQLQRTLCYSCSYIVL